MLKSIESCEDTLSEKPAMMDCDEKKVVKEGLSEYFMFSIEGTETIKNGWSKRMRAVTAEGSKMPMSQIRRPVCKLSTSRIPRVHRSSVAWTRPALHLVSRSRGPTPMSRTLSLVCRLLTLQTQEDRRSSAAWTRPTLPGAWRYRVATLTSQIGMLVCK